MWGKNAGKTVIAIKNMSRTTENHIFGKALYTVCKRNTKDCHKVKFALDYTFRP
jgi:hypothetical protein